MAQFILGSLVCELPMHLGVLLPPIFASIYGAHYVYYADTLPQIVVNICVCGEEKKKKRKKKDGAISKLIMAFLFYDTISELV